MIPYYKRNLQFIITYDLKLENFKRHVPPFRYFYNKELLAKVYNMFKDDFINFKIPSDINN